LENFRKKFSFIKEIESSTINGNELILKSSKRCIKITILSEKIFRLRATNSLEFSPDYSWTVEKKEWDKVAIDIQDKEDIIEIYLKDLILIINKKPFRLIVKDKEDIIWEDTEPSGIGWKDNQIIYIKKMPKDEHYFGFGEKTGHLDKRGYHYVMKTREAVGYQGKTDPLYQAHPFFIGINNGKSYGIFFDNTWETYFDMGKKFNDHYFFGAKNGELNVYFFYGPTIKEVITNYTELIGRILLPPIWSLGYHQSRWGYDNEEKVRHIASELRSRQIPSDSIVLDIGYMDGYRVYTWNKKRFPNDNFFKNCTKTTGLNFITIIDPGVKIEKNYFMYQEGIENDLFVKKKNGKYWKGYVWPGATYFPDFTKEETRKWWGDKLKILLDRGISGIWNDMNEPSYNIQLFIHRVKTNDLIFYDNGLNTPFEKNRNVYGLLMGRATHEGLLRHNPNKRPFILTRSGFCGIHKYAAVWTGDNTSNWKHLAMSIPMLLNMGLSSIPNCGADIGGFNFWFTAPRKLLFKLSKDLIIRWHQLGAFYPFSRNHSVKQSRPQEPWEFGQEAEEIIKKYLRLRYHWMPYFYNLFVKCSNNGLPPMRPLILEFPDDETCYTIDYEFLWGEFILIAPVIKKKQRFQEIYLPKGTWIYYWNNEKFDGNQFITIESSLNDIPIFIKSGAIIPCQPDMVYFKEKEMNPLIIELYPDIDNYSQTSYTFQEDDGESLNYLNGEFCTTQFKMECSENLTSFIIEDRMGKFNPDKRDYLLLFKAVNKPNEITLNNEKINEILSIKQNSWKYNPELRELTIMFEDIGKKQIIELHY